MTNELMSKEIIENKVYIIRNQRVMLDKDLAWLYEVETKVLNQAVKRNPERFPEDFMFQLTKEEWENLRFQFGTSNLENPSLRSQFATSKEEDGRGGQRYLPYAFTEHGVAMLSSVLRSKRAIAINIQINVILNLFQDLSSILRWKDAELNSA